MRYLFLTALLPIAGCSGTIEPQAVKDCQANLLLKLKAPSTFKRVKVTSAVDPDSSGRQWLVDIEYDAANAFNAPLRAREICRYAVKDGGPDATRPIFGGDREVMDPVAANLSAEADAIANGTAP